MNTKTHENDTREAVAESIFGVGDLPVDDECTCGLSDRIAEDGAGQRDYPDLHASDCRFRLADEAES